MRGDEHLSTAADQAEDARDHASAAVKNAKDAAVSAAKGVRASASDIRDGAAAKTEEMKANAASIANDLRARANDHIGDAKSAVSAMADDARLTISDIVDHNKAAGADRLSNISMAAQNAANDLADKNPQVARVVQKAADHVDRFAGDLRSANLSDIAETVATFARRQPVAFFAGSMMAGFLLARFLRSDPDSRS